VELKLNFIHASIMIIQCGDQLDDEKKFDLFIVVSNESVNLA